jgi:hypothetical protein
MKKATRAAGFKGPAGTLFTPLPGGRALVTRHDQPECAVPRVDLLAYKLTMMPDVPRVRALAAALRAMTAAAQPGRGPGRR